MRNERIGYDVGRGEMSSVRGKESGDVRDSDGKAGGRRVKALGFPQISDCHGIIGMYIQICVSV